MVSVISETVLKSGREADWDAAYRERAADARNQEGWVDLHLLVPLDRPTSRVVVGTWRDRASWEKWHDTEVFRRTREILDEATESTDADRWFEVVEERTSG